MFETLVVNILNRYLGAYVVGLNSEQLRVAVWQGSCAGERSNTKATSSWKAFH